MKIASKLLISSLPMLLTACVSMPDWSESDVPEEFREQIGQANSYPEFGATPSAPTDVPSEAEWNAKKSEFEALKDSFNTIDLSPTSTRAEMDALIARLQAYVSAYKLDDPQ